MEKATDNETNAHYNDEVLFLEGIIEFHPEIYDSLSVEDQEVLKTYYAIDQSMPTVPENIFEYRKSSCKSSQTFKRGQRRLLTSF